MEGFATGFALAQATRPGHSVENDKFRVTFTGVMCNEAKNIVSHGFESCYDWGPVMELVLSAASEDYSSVPAIEERAERSMRGWLASFRGWGLLASILPTLKHRYFILSLAYTSANWDPDSGGDHSEEKVFEAVKTVFDAVPGKEVSSLIPKFGMWFEEMEEGGIEEQRKKNFTLFFDAKWVLEARFVVEKKRRVGSLVARSAEAVVRRLESEEEVVALEVPRTLLPCLVASLRDAQWVRSYWGYKAALMEQDFYGNELGALESDGHFKGRWACEDLPADLPKEEEEEMLAEEVMAEVLEAEAEAAPDRGEVGGLLTASLGWALYALLVFFGYVFYIHYIAFVFS